MKFIADFHVHSKFSRATSQHLDLENLYIAAQVKGITVVGTGDFTHPQWFLEISEKLVPAEEGLYRLKEKIALACDKEVPLSCRSTVRFILTTEISNIYKKGDKTRKNHNLVMVPDLKTAARINEKLGAVGNIHSDGRPILGLDAKNLLEILFETSEQSVLIPAHIWTPWFSVMGSKSGFDSIEECFEEHSKYIFAVETGLSSDPAMNWRVSRLDKYTLISNSDAHAPQNLGRESNIFNTDLSYHHIFSAIKDRNDEKFLGTYEFFPEEGKYHLDGHRKCNVFFYPKKTNQNNGICPKCGRPLTLGVLNRVEELADRPVTVLPEKHPPFYSSIPLTEILAEILKSGPKSKTVQKQYYKFLNELGSESNILHDLSIENIQRSGAPLLAEAISRMRRGELFIAPGYDGEYGKVKIFNPGEKEKYFGQKTLFEPPPKKIKVQKKGIKDTQPKAVIISANISTPFLLSEDNKDIEKKELNSEQIQAVQVKNRATIIVAGPGTGKTLTLTRRIAHVMTNQNVFPENILAVTFTNKAAHEMYERISVGNTTSQKMPLITTFHGFCYQILRELNQNLSDVSAPNPAHTIIDETEQMFFLNEAVDLFKSQGGQVSANPANLLEHIRLAKQMLMDSSDINGSFASEFSTSLDTKGFSVLYGLYQQLLSHQHLYDFEDLIFKTVKKLESDPAARKKYQDRFQFIFVDEFQDINLGQHRLLQLLSSPAVQICVIGDPDQSIYGFRGSDTKYFQEFISAFDDAEVIKLTRNYRSTRAIVDAAHQLISRQPVGTKKDTVQHIPFLAEEFRQRNYSYKEGYKTITMIEAASERAEAVAVGKMIETMIGGTGFHYIDFNAQKPVTAELDRSFSDFAVLYRTGIQGKIFSEVFGAAGIPHQLVNRDSIYADKGISETISLLRLISGVGSFMDMERLKDILPPGVSLSILKHFRKWSFGNKTNLYESLKHVRRFPIHGMRKSGQKQLIRFLDRLDQMRRETENMTVRETLDYVAGKTDLATAVQNKEQSALAFRVLREHAETYGRRHADFIATLALQNDTDMYVPRSERVALMTMHAAKGLEFPVVFICGCENGYIPLQRSGAAQTDSAEERRLFYVAMTRAKERLFFTYARTRRIYGKKEIRKASPFIEQIDLRLKEIPAPSDLKKKSQRQLELF